MKRWVSTILPFIGLLVFAIILQRTGLHRIGAVFRSARLEMLWLLPLLLVVIVALRGLRWQYLMRMVGIRYPLWKCTVRWVIGFFAGAVTPGKVGDGLRAFYISQETNTNFGVAFLTVFVDRLMDLVVVVLAGVVTLLLFSRYYTEIPSVWIVATSVAVIAVSIYLLLNRRLMRRLLKPLARVLVPERYAEVFSASFNEFYNALGVYGRAAGKTTFAFFLTLVYWVLVFVLAWYVTLLLRLDVPPHYVALIMPIITLAELLPISISGLGTREAASIYFLAVIGISSAQAVGFSIAYLLAGTYLTSVVGFLFWLRHPVKLGDPGR